MGIDRVSGEDLEQFFSVFGQSLSQMHLDLVRVMEDAVTEGLLRKGFEFKNRCELVQFVKQNCRSAEFIQSKQRTYYVFDTPFLIEYFSIIIEHETDPHKAKVSVGGFRYL